MPFSRERILQQVSGVTLTRRCRETQMSELCSAAAVSPFSINHSQWATQPPRTSIAKEQPRLASSDCLMSSHTLTLQPQQRPYPNHTNFPFFPANPPQNYSNRRQEIAHRVCWFRFSKSHLGLGFMPAGVNVTCEMMWTMWNNCTESGVH